jgi:hypothetical protein
LPANGATIHALSDDQNRPLRDHHHRRIRNRAPALIVSLPLTSLLALIWLWHDTGDKARAASLAQSTFWFVLPALPMFLVMVLLLRHGLNFWVTLAIGCALTIVLYLVTVRLLDKFGVALRKTRFTSALLLQ